MKLRQAIKILGSLRPVQWHRYLRAVKRSNRAWCTAHPHDHYWNITTQRCARCGLPRIGFVNTGEACPAARWPYRVLPFNAPTFCPPFRDDALAMQKFLNRVYDHLQKRMIEQAGLPPDLLKGNP